MVVTYHYVRPRNSDGVTGLSPEHFEHQLARAKRSTRFVTLAEFIALEAQPSDGPAGLTLQIEGKRAGLVTFDDALLDQWTHALPVLEKLGVPAVFFVPMRPFSDEQDRWTTQHLLHALAQHMGWRALEQAVHEQLRAMGLAVEVDRAAADRLYHYEVPHKRALKWTLAFGLSADQASDAVRRINNRSAGLDPTDWFMSRRQVVALQDMGHAVGGHGFDHVPYTALTPRAQLADMQRAQRWMTSLLGAMPRALAFPFGRGDAQTLRLAQLCGYTRCFTTDDRTDACALDALLDRSDAARALGRSCVGEPRAGTQPAARGSAA